MTPEGLKVMGGVFQFYETEGLPLDDILASLWEHNALPDWVDLVLSMTRAGRPLDRTFESVYAAVNDACYPIDYRDGIVAGLQRLQRALKPVKTTPDG